MGQDYEELLSAFEHVAQMMQLIVEHMERFKRERDEARSLLTPDQLAQLAALDDLEALANEVNTHMEPSFDSAGDTAPNPAAPPRPPATGVADIDDAGTQTTGGAR